MTSFLADPDVTVYVGDALAVLRSLPDGCVDCCVTSPPYWGLRDYGSPGQLGLEATPEEYVAALVGVFGEVRRVLADGGTCWLNLGDSYSHGGNGSRDPERWPKQSRNDHRVEHAKAGGDTKPKDLVGIPWRVAFALQADGWWLRSDIVWSKPNPMPESVTDRPTKAHEYVFLLAKRPRYFYDAEAIRERQDEVTRRAASFRDGGVYTSNRSHDNGADKTKLTHGDGDLAAGRNARSVWEIATHPYPEAHFATYPEELVRRCLLAGCPEGGTVLDPFLGSGTTALVARKHGRRCVGIELNETYAKLAAQCGCHRPLPDAAVHGGDVFATRACAAAHYGTEAVSPASSPVGETRGGHHARVVFDGAAVPFNELTRDRARADVVARLRVAAEKRRP